MKKIKKIKEQIEIERLNQVLSTANYRKQELDRKIEKLEETVQIQDAYAETLYMHEVLKSRQGTLTGPVRFDIALGSKVRIEAAEDKFVQRLLYPDPEDSAGCASKSYYYANILRVGLKDDRDGIALTQA